MQWLSGALVLILCIVNRGEFSRQIVTKLGSSFSTVAFLIVVVSLIELFLFSFSALEFREFVGITKMTLLSLKKHYMICDMMFIFAGNLHHFSNGCDCTTCSTFMLPYPSYQEGKLFLMFN
jgi:hypothetical protein